MAKEIRGDSNEESNKISVDAFKNYFHQLLNPTQVPFNMQYAPGYWIDDVLDRRISLEEIKKVLSKAKYNKAPGEDRITYEFYKNATHDFLKRMTDAFNIIFESGQVEEAFVKSIVFPIHKKGDRSQPTNFRGISFMNVIAKIMMGILSERLYEWVERKGILNEAQAGFRRGYSTVDNIFNLAAIVNIKFNEKKKVYAFFVDFRAAFDKVSRRALIFKLESLGISSKILKLLESVYRDTRSAVWTGHELSESFETHVGVKQGCLLSPLLFILYINDLFECLEGGVNIDGKNIRLLMYADDIVLLADKVEVLQNMITNLEKYCRLWNLEVNLSKSEIMIFRRGGKIAKNEKWTFNNETVKIVAEYRYLGVTLTPKMSFSKHVDIRNALAKCSINTTWNNFLSKSEITLSSKWNIFQAVCRAIQTYASQVWGFCHFEEVDSLQLFFMKRILNLPSFTPTYILFLETGVENNFVYSLNLHLRYFCKTLFEYDTSRLPHFLSKKLVEENLFCIKELRKLQSKYNVQWNLRNFNRYVWESSIIQLLSNIKLSTYQEHLQKAVASNRFYRYLNFCAGPNYINNSCKSIHIMWVFKARSDLIELNATRFGIGKSKKCSLCNLHEEETLPHFIGRCPILKEFRLKYFFNTALSETEIITILNEKTYHRNLVKYVIEALNYRKILITEFNY